MRFKPERVFEKSKGDQNPPLSNGVERTINDTADAAETKLRCKAVKLQWFDFANDSEREIAKLQYGRVASWLDAYGKFLYGNVKLDGQLIVFSREDDAATFWYQCIKNKRVFSSEPDIFNH